MGHRWVTTVAHVRSVTVLTCIPTGRAHGSRSLQAGHEGSIPFARSNRVSVAQPASPPLWADHRRVPIRGRGPCWQIIAVSARVLEWPRRTMSSLRLVPVVAASVPPTGRRSWKCRRGNPAFARADFQTESWTAEAARHSYSLNRAQSGCPSARSALCDSAEVLHAAKSPVLVSE